MNRAPTDLQAHGEVVSTTKMIVSKDSKTIKSFAERGTNSELLQKAATLD